MSLKVVGARPLETASIANILGGSTVASLQVRLRFVTGAWTAGDARIFCVKEFSFGITCFTAPGQIDVRVANAAGADYAYRPTLSMDADHHLLLTYDGTNVRFYIDTVLVSTAPLSGPLSTAAGIFTFGSRWSDNPTREIQVDDLVFALQACTQQQVIDLCDRVSTPAQVFGANLKFYVTLDGADGLTVADGSAGITDQSANAYPVLAATASRPVYQARALTSLPDVAVRRVKIGPGRDSLFVELETAGGLDVKLSSFVSHPRLTVSGGAPVQLANPIYGIKFGHVMYPLSAPVAVGAVATLDADVRWATTNLGLTAAVVGRAVDTSATGVLPAYDPAALRPMKVGNNLAHDLYYGIMIFSANMREQFGGYGGNPALVLDADGYLTAASTAGATNPLSTSFPNPVPGRPPYVAAPPGDYTLLYTTDNADHLSLVASGPVGGATSTLRPELSDETGVVKKRVYRVALGSEVTPALYLATPSYHARVSAIYPPGVDVANPPQFYPKFTQALAGMKVLRSLDAMLINNSSITEYAHWHSETAIGAEQPRVIKEFSVLSIEPDPNTDGFRGPNSGRVKLNTAAAHGLLEGQVAVFRGPTSGPTSNGVFPMTGGSQAVLDQLFSTVHVLSPTSFTMEAYLPSSGTLLQSYTGTTLQPVGPAPTVIMETGKGWSPQKMVDICNAVGANLWFCMPLLMSDAGVTATMNMIAGRLLPGLKVHLELSNEVWNTGFTQTGYVQSAGRLQALTGGQYYAKRAGQVHALARAAFTAAARPATDVIRTFATQGANSAVTDELVTYCQANTIPIDELAVGTYINIRGFEPEFDRTAEATYRLLSIGQMHDMYQVRLALGGYKQAFHDNHRAILNAKGFATAKISVYEGSLDYCCPFADAGTALTLAQKGAISRAVHRHPRMTETWGAWLRAMGESWGFDTFCNYKVEGGPFSDGFGTAATNWCTYWGYEALSDSTATPASVRNVDPDDLTQIVSTNGAALSRYASADGLGTGGPAPPPVPATSYALSGPSTVAAGQPATIAVLLGSGTFSGSVVVTPVAAAGQVYSPASVTLTAASTTAMFSATRSTAGTMTIATTNDRGLTSSSLSLTVTDAGVVVPVPAATAYALSAPLVGTAGVALSVTATAGSGSITGTIIVSPTAATGVVFTGTASLTNIVRSGSFTATKAAGGVLTVATTNNGSLTDPASALIAIAVRPAAADVRTGVDRGDGVLGTLAAGGFDPMPAGVRLRFPGRQTTIRPLKGESRGPFGDRIRARAGFDRIWVITLRDEAGVIGDWAAGDVPSAFFWLGDLSRRVTASLVPVIAWHDTIVGGVERPGRLAGELRLTASADLTRGKGGTYGAIARIVTGGGEMIEAWSGTVEIANSLVL